MPFHFKWTDPETAWDDAFAAGSDEDIFAFDLEHNEGEFASLRLTIRNPKIGLLSTGRKVWAWFAHSEGATITPLFFGRLIGVPSNVFAEKVDLDFQARPLTFDADKNALADTLRVLPYYDPVFIDEDKRADPDTVLEARSEDWHIDPITQEVTTSDLITGEDGLIEFAASEILYSKVSLDIGQIPIRKVHMDVTFTWQQRAYGTVELMSGSRIGSFNNLEGAWPKDGAGIGSGWSVLTASCNALYTLESYSESSQSSARPPNSDEIDGDSWAGVTSQSFSRSGSRPIPPGSVFLAAEVEGTQTLTIDEKTGNHTSASVSSTRRQSVIVANYYDCNLTVQFDPDRTQTETISFDVTADMQDIVTLPEDADVTFLTLDSQSLSQTIPYDKTYDNAVTNPNFPIVDTRKRSYVTTPRGLSSLEYAILVCRATIRGNSRAVTIKFETTSLTKWFDVTLRKTGKMNDTRMPGGFASGKITGRALSLDGNTGYLARQVTISCAVGKGGSWDAEVGTPSYCSADYCGNDYQEYIGGKNVVGEDIQYEVPRYAPQDDGIDLRRGFGGGFLAEILNQHSDQQTIFQSYSETFPVDSSNPSSNAAALTAFIANSRNAADDIKTRFSWNLPPLNGEWSTPYEIVVSPIKIPRMIDLEAGA